MQRTRLRGMIFMGVGFAIAMAAGLALAVRASSEEIETNTVLAGSFAAFMVIAPLIIYGIYLYVQEDDPIAPDEVSIVEKQRELMDVLRERGRVTVPEMATALGVSQSDVREMINQLIDLEIFRGEVDWTDEVLYAGESSRPRLG